MQMLTLPLGSGLLLQNAPVMIAKRLKLFFSACFRCKHSDTCWSTHPATGRFASPSASPLSDGANNAYCLATVGMTVLTVPKWLQEHLVMY